MCGRMAQATVQAMWGGEAFLEQMVPGIHRWAVPSSWGAGRHLGCGEMIFWILCHSKVEMKQLDVLTNLAIGLMCGEAPGGGKDGRD